MEFDGKNGGKIELLDDVLVIKRYGVASKLNHGLKGDKRIPYASVTSVQFKPAGMTTGYIQFGVMGGIESGRGVVGAVGDENTVLFIKTRQADFEHVRDEVERRAAEARSGGRSSAAPVALGEELSRLADLRDRGVLDEDEFQAEKARLMASRNSGSTRAPRSPLPSPAYQPVEEVKAGSIGKKLGVGCLVIVGLLIVLGIIGALNGPEQANNSVEAVPNAAKSTGSAREGGTAGAASKAAPEEKVSLTSAQGNAARSARQYLSMSGFSRKGLIAQLSSEAGEGYSVADATAAVDSLGEDWKGHAARSAKSYLEMSGFSCKGLIQQLSSSAGEKYTVAEATYGAQQAGAC